MRTFEVTLFLYKKNFETTFNHKINFKIQTFVFDSKVMFLTKPYKVYSKFYMVKINIKH